MKTIRRKSVFMFALCIGIAVMAIAYAAFSTSLSISATSSQSGTFSVKVLAESASVTGTAGLSGATAPTANCGSTSAATSVTMSASLNQPGDTVTCKYKTTNAGNLKAKANGNYSCTPSNGMTTSASSSGATPMYYTVSWAKSALAAGATSNSGEIQVTITYSASITSQPSKTSGSVTCTFPYTQNI